MRRRFGPEAGPPPIEEVKKAPGAPSPEALLSRLQGPEEDETPEQRRMRRIEAPESAKSPELREREEQVLARLDAADLESLLSVIAEAETLRRYEREAAETIARYGKETPSLAESLLTPQSPDKHAEGPFMEDHLRLILVSLYAIRDGKVRLRDLPETRAVLGALSKDEAKKIIDELKRNEELIKEYVKFFEVFALYHDIAKPDTTGFSSESGSAGEALGFVKFDSLFPAKKKMTEEEKEARREVKEEYRNRLSKLYRELLLGFAERNSALLGEPSRFQEAFYGEYKISLTHYEHGEVASEGPKQDDIRKACRAAGLSEDEAALMLKMIELHIEPHTRFAGGVEPKKYGSLLKKVEGFSVSPREILRYVRAGALLDVLGTKKIAEGGRRVSDLSLSVNFMRAELAYDEMLKEQERLAAERQAEAEAGFTAEWLMSELGLQGKDIGEALRAVRAAVFLEPLELPPALEPHRAKLEEKLSKLRKSSN